MLGTGNVRPARSVAEAILNREGKGRFTAYSVPAAALAARSIPTPSPASRISGYVRRRRPALEELERVRRPGCSRDGFRLHPSATTLPANSCPPIWPGRPNAPPIGAFPTPPQRRAPRPRSRLAFDDAYHMLATRIGIFRQSGPMTHTAADRVPTPSNTRDCTTDLTRCRNSSATSRSGRSPHRRAHEGPECGWDAAGGVLFALLRSFEPMRRWCSRIKQQELWVALGDTAAHAEARPPARSSSARSPRWLRRDPALGRSDDFSDCPESRRPDSPPGLPVCEGSTLSIPLAVPVCG